MSAESNGAAGLSEEDLAGGGLVRLTMAFGKGNILTAAACETLAGALDRVFARPQLRAVIVDAKGGHFSFGASVAEHLPGQVEQMLPRFHGLLRKLITSPVPVLAAVAGNCLGGGLELALACTRIVAHPEARLGQPETLLGVLAPAASVLLPLRLGPGESADLLLSGRTLGAREARGMGLVDELCGDDETATARATAWATEALLPKSAASVRLALKAARVLRLPRTLEALDEVERIYLLELMATADAREGLQAFLDKRPARFEHR